MLNEALYRAIMRTYGEEPDIVNEGEPAAVTYPPPAISFAPTLTVIPAKNINGGEQYRINCPYCKDQRHRLYFSYLWNTRISYNGSTYVCTKHLARCFNEECQRAPANFEDICTRIDA